MASLLDLGINPTPQYADAAYQQQAGSAAATTGLQAQHLSDLYNGSQGVQGSAEQIQNSEGAQGNLYSGGAQQAEQANKQQYSYDSGNLWNGLKSNLASLASQRFFTAVGANVGGAA